MVQFVGIPPFPRGISVNARKHFNTPVEDTFDEKPLCDVKYVQLGSIISLNLLQEPNIKLQ